MVETQEHAAPPAPSAPPATGDVYAFDHDHGVAARDLSDLLGGKGAGLAEMTTALGLPVPPGFTIGLPICGQYRDAGWPGTLDDAIDTHLGRLEAALGRGFGAAADPLLVAVRSGAPVSMPGMLDTILNLGLNDDTVQGLAQVSGDARFAWDSYRRFVQMFAITVLGVGADDLPEEPADADAGALETFTRELQERVATLAGRPVPQDARTQLREAIEAVFRSWDSSRARAYRAKESIPEDMGTAVNVQAMVFGNRGGDSGTGVVFTRDPSTGAPGAYGDYLPNAQGEEVVAGTARTMPIAVLAERHPDVHAQLTEVLGRLEQHYRDLCDVEFTVEDGRLWVLQTRAGKRGATAAVRIAVHLVEDPDIALTHDEALERVPADTRAKARAEVIAAAGHGAHDADLLTTALGASAGRVSGAIVLNSDDAADAENDVILVRAETSPEDVAGMAASVGVLTTKGGLVSHAAVVARGWGIPAVVGAEDITWSPDELRIGEQTLHVGDVITIDGTSGQVWAGAIESAAGADADALAEIVAAELPELVQLESWAAEQDTIGDAGDGAGDQADSGSGGPA